MNLNFVKEIFSSEAFLEDYQQFLFHIDFYLQEDNKKKLKKFLDLLMKCGKIIILKVLDLQRYFRGLIRGLRKTAFELFENKSLVTRKQVKLY